MTRQRPRRSRSLVDAMRGKFDLRRRHSLSSNIAPKDTMNVFCSDMLSMDAIRRRLQKVSSDAKIVKIEVEDLIVSGHCGSLLSTVKSLILQQGNREWQSVSIVDSLGAAQLEWWDEQRLEIMRDYQPELVDPKQRDVFTFQANIHCGAGTDLQSFLDLLLVIRQYDDAIEVDFAGALYGYADTSIYYAMDDKFENGELQESITIRIKCGWRKNALWSLMLDACIQAATAIMYGNTTTTTLLSSSLDNTDTPSVPPVPQAQFLRPRGRMQQRQQSSSGAPPKRSKSLAGLATKRSRGRALQRSPKTKGKPTKAAKTQDEGPSYSWESGKKDLAKTSRKDQPCYQWEQQQQSTEKPSYSWEKMTRRSSDNGASDDRRTDRKPPRRSHSASGSAMLSMISKGSPPEPRRTRQPPRRCKSTDFGSIVHQDSSDYHQSPPCRRRPVRGKALDYSNNQVKDIRLALTKANKRGSLDNSMQTPRRRPARSKSMDLSSHPEFMDLQRGKSRRMDNSYNQESPRRRPARSKSMDLSSHPEFMDLQRGNNWQTTMSPNKKSRRVDNSYNQESPRRRPMRSKSMHLSYPELTDLASRQTPRKQPSKFADRRSSILAAAPLTAIISANDRTQLDSIDSLNQPKKRRPVRSKSMDLSHPSVMNLSAKGRTQFDGIDSLNQPKKRRPVRSKSIDLSHPAVMNLEKETKRAAKKKPIRRCKSSDYDEASQISDKSWPMSSRPKTTDDDRSYPPFKFRSSAKKIVNERSDEDAARRKSRESMAIPDDDALSVAAVCERGPDFEWTSKSPRFIPRNDAALKNFRSKSSKTKRLRRSKSAVYTATKSGHLAFHGSASYNWDSHADGASLGYDGSASYNWDMHACGSSNSQDEICHDWSTKASKRRSKCSRTNSCKRLSKTLPKKSAETGFDWVSIAAKEAKEASKADGGRSKMRRSKSHLGCTSDAMVVPDCNWPQISPRQKVNSPDTVSFNWELSKIETKKTCSQTGVNVDGPTIPDFDWSQGGVDLSAL